MSSPPNILWVSFEDTNPFYSCYGDPVARTPNLDRLAAEGCIYPKAFSTAGVCAPARAAVITGMYPNAIGAHHMRTSWTNPATPELPTPYEAVPPAYVKCFTEHLRRNGYYCTNNNKTDYQFNSPFTAWDDCSSEAHWRNRPDTNQPFFAVWNPHMTHESGMWPENCPEIKFDPADMVVPPTFPDTPKVRESLARMYTQIEIADGILGKLLEQLEEDGLSDNTIVMHWSDHGPLPRGKRWPYDSGIHVPMIIKAPGIIDGGSINHRLVSTLDLAPTVLSLCGIEVPPTLQGKAFLGDQAEEPRTYIHASRDRYDESYDKVRAARDVKYKYIRHDHPEKPYMIWVPYLNRHPIMEELWQGHLDDTLKPEESLLFRARPVEELYDTESDPHEMNNLASDPKHKEHLLRLRGECERWCQEIGDMGQLDESEMVRSWWPDGIQPTTATPILIPIQPNHYGQEPASGPLEPNSKVHLHCTTQGSSIDYRYQGESAWRLYHLPFSPECGKTLEVKAIRIGYKESQVAINQL